MSEDRKVLKWDVPVDDHEHPIGSGKVCLVTTQRGPQVVTVWTEESPRVIEPRAAIVVGTGQKVPEGWEHIGSCLSHTFVWHVYAPPAKP